MVGIFGDSPGLGWVSLWFATTATMLELWPQEIDDSEPLHFLSELSFWGVGAMFDPRGSYNISAREICRFQGIASTRLEKASKLSADFCKVALCINVEPGGVDWF